MDEVATVNQPNEVSQPNPFTRFNITQVSNGYLVETKDKNWNGVESVHMNIDTVIEALKEAFINN